MSLTRDDFAAAFRALHSKAKTPKDVRAAFREQSALVDKGQRKTIAELLGVPPGPQADLRSDPAALDAVGEILIELEIANEPEVEKLAASYLSRTYRKSLPDVTMPKSLAKLDLQWEIGRGRTGVVYRGRRSEAPHEVAIKIFRGDAKPDPARLADFPKIVAPGLAKVYETDYEYTVTEFIEGSSVDALIAERKISLRRAFEVIQKAAVTLAPLHARPQAHGSLAPGSIIVDPREDVKIVEFGLWPGTPADDVFALGAILYEVAAGVPPYDGYHARDLRPPSRFNPSCAGGAERIIMKALARDPSRRYPEAGSLADDIGRWLRHEQVLAEEPGATSAAPKKNRLPLIIGVAAAVLLVVVTIILSRPSAKNKSDTPKVADTPKTDAPRTTDTAPPPDPATTKATPPVPPKDARREAIAKKGPIRWEEEQDLRERGNQAMVRGDYDALLVLGDEYLIRNCNRDYAYEWMAVAYRAKKDPEKALEAIDNAINLAPENTRYVQFRLPLLLQRAEAQRALKDIEALYGRNTTVPIRELTQRIAAEPDPELHLQRGALLYHRKQYPQAAADFATVARGDSKALYFLGLALMKAEKKQDAIDALRKFLTAHASLPVADEARAVLSELEK